MAGYGHDFGAAGRPGQPGTWTHFGRGHGRGGWVEHDQDWRNNWNSLAGGGRRRMGPPSYFSVGGRYLGESRGGRYGREYGAEYRGGRGPGRGPGYGWAYENRARGGSGYGEDFRRGEWRGGYGRGW